jgi:tRNA (guanine37-N1)-methyltransferase
MNYTIYTLFPNLITPWLNEALLAKAIERELINVDVRDLRKHAGNKHNRVGMVIRVDVAAKAIAEVREESQVDEVILLSPAGETFTQKIAEELAGKKHLLFLCGRYEGFDARVEKLVTRELSIGDYVLMGGEVAALTIIEATARLIPDVLGDAESHQQDSFSTGLLDYPEYTRPLEFNGESIPEILLSGHHANIETWRRQEALKRTFKRRPELLEEPRLSKKDKEIVKSLKENVDEKYRLRFFFDVGSGICLWSANDKAREKFGYPIELENLPLSDKTKDRLFDLIKWYDQSIDWNDPGSDSPWTREEVMHFKESAFSVLVNVREELDNKFEIIDELDKVAR